MMGPPKPPRVVQSSAPQNNVITNGALMMRTRSEISNRSSTSNKAQVIDTKSQLPVASIAERLIAKAEVRTALQQWQLAQMDSEKNGYVLLMRERVKLAKSLNSQIIFRSVNKSLSNGLPTKRREPRRHTLQNGIDQSMVIRLLYSSYTNQVIRYFYLF